MNPIYVDDEELVLAGDVSKGYCDFVLMDAHERVLQQDFQLDDTPQGHRTLRQLLDRWADQYGWSRLYCAVESTGGYENNWLSSLRCWAGPLRLVPLRLNPGPIRHHLRSRGRHTITDAISARHIGCYLISEHPSPRKPEPVSKRQLFTALELQKQQRTQLISQLEKWLYTAAPELLAYTDHGWPQWLLQLLTRWPTAAQLATASPDELAQIPYVTPTRAARLIERARQSIAGRPDGVYGHLIAQQARQLRDQQQLIDRLTAQLEGQAADDPRIGWLLPLKGMGVYAAVGLLLEVGDIASFDHPGQLAAYWGVQPAWKDSGDGHDNWRMSKHGRARARRLLFHVAQTAAHHDPYLSQWFARLRRRGKAYYEALGALMHKITRIIYGILTHQQPYDPEIDRAHRRRSQSKNTTRSRQPAPATARQRRFQAPQAEAPVSSRARKRRKKIPADSGSQSGLTATREITQTEPD